MIINDFDKGFLLIGYSLTTRDNVSRYALNFVFKSDSVNGLGTYRITCEQGKLEKLLGNKPEINKCYLVSTDKFLNSEKQLITYLKDISLID